MASAAERRLMANAAKAVRTAIGPKKSTTPKPATRTSITYKGSSKNKVVTTQRVGASRGTDATSEGAQNRSRRRTSTTTVSTPKGTTTTSTSVKPATTTSSATGISAQTHTPKPSSSVVQKAGSLLKKGGKGRGKARRGTVLYKAQRYKGAGPKVSGAAVAQFKRSHKWAQKGDKQTNERVIQILKYLNRKKSGTVKPKGTERINTAAPVAVPKPPNKPDEPPK